MAKKDIIGTYSDSFETTSKGQSFAKRMNDLEVALKKAKKPYVIGYKNAMAKVDADRKTFGWNLPRVNSRYAEIQTQYNFEIRTDATIQKILADIKDLKSEKENAIKVYAEKIEGNDAWNWVSHRAYCSGVLRILRDSGRMTEFELEKVWYGNGEAKQNRLCFPLKYLETLGWIVRDGSGNSGDALISSITDEGKRQIDFYERFGKFDSSMIA